MLIFKLVIRISPDKFSAQVGIGSGSDLVKLNLETHPLRQIVLNDFKWKL